MSRILNVIKSPANLLALLVALLCITLHFTGAESVLKLDRDAIANGSIWLLLTGNFVHLGQNHLWLNLAGFMLVALLVWANFTWWQWLLIIVISSLGVGIGLFLFDPSVAYYVGFSGTLHGLIMAGSLADLRRFPKAAALLLIMVIGKLIWEQLYGPMPGSETTVGGSVVVNSHLYGAITGGLLGLVFLGLGWVDDVTKDTDSRHE